MAISFNHIPSAIRVPLTYIEFDNSKAVSGTPSALQKVLMLGTKLPTGTATAGQAVRVTAHSQAKTLFGRGSQLAEMVKTFKAHNNMLDLWCLPLDEAESGAKATGSVQLVGTATQAGTLSLMIAGTNYKQAVSSGDTAAMLASKLQKLIAADSDVPVTATVSDSTITLTCRFKGEAGNDIDVRCNYYSGETLPEGIKVNIRLISI